jgi:type I restriction enzyme R subunit
MIDEAHLLENWFIERLKELNWKYIEPDKLGREQEEEPLILKTLASSIRRINQGIELTDRDIGILTSLLVNKPATSEGAREVLNYLKRGMPHIPEKSTTLENIYLIDYEHIDNNEFVVTNQVRFKNRKGEGIRPDLVLYINGIPLVLLELKNPADPSKSWDDAFKQVKRRYEPTVPELFKYVQFSVAACGTAKYFPNALGAKEEEISIEEWRKEEQPESENGLKGILEMLSRNKLLDIIRNFIFFSAPKKALTKILPRYMQYRATNAIYSRVINYLKRRELKNRGLVWHWQGAGKTFTMVFASYKFLHEKLLNNPTIIFVVDREDLQVQLEEVFSSLDFGVGKPEVVSSIRELKEILMHGEGEGKRGLFITLIHKFREKEFVELRKTLELSPYKTILDRENVVAFVDEGDRSQYGRLAETMQGLLKNAFYFAFTGTPIAKRGRDTYLQFAYPKEGEYYLDKYFMGESLKDKFTVDIMIHPRLEKDVHLSKEEWKEFLKEKLEEIPEEARTDTEIEIAKKLNHLVVRLEDPLRIKKIASDIAADFKENLDGKFKAMVVTASRKACVRYKKELDKNLPSPYSEIVMSYSSEIEDKEVRNYVEELKKKEKLDQLNKKTIKRFHLEEEPKILVVCSMLLRGFDEPILQTIYLDKPLKGHTLIQAISRVNRPYHEQKYLGRVIDYVGLLREYESALAMYSEEDRGKPLEIEKATEVLVRAIEDLEEIFPGIELKKIDIDTLKECAKSLCVDDEKTKKFLEVYKRLIKIRNSLGPRYTQDYREKIKLFTGIYVVYKRLTEGKHPAAKVFAMRYFKEILDSIYENIHIQDLDRSFPLLGFNQDTVKKLSELVPSDLRAHNLLFMLQRYVLVEKSRDPVYLSIAEKVEKIIKEWKKKKAELQEFYDDLKNCANECFKIEKRKEEIKLPPIGYSLLSLLEKKIGRTREVASRVKEFTEDLEKKDMLFKGWNKKDETLKAVFREIKKFLWRFVKEKKISLEATNEVEKNLERYFK